MKVRAKFYVTKISDRGEDGKDITLQPVYDGSEENRDFFRYTPAGQIDIGIVNPSAAEAFVEGQEYYVDFTPAD